MFDAMKFSGIDYHDTEKVVEPDHKVNPDRKELVEEKAAYTPRESEAVAELKAQMEKYQKLMT